MQCEQCKWFVGNVNDHYGICKRYPTNQNKPKNDFCGEFTNKNVAFEVTTIAGEVGVGITEKRGRKPKNVD